MTAPRRIAVLLALLGGCDGGGGPTPTPEVEWFRDVSVASGVDAAFDGAQTFSQGVAVADVDGDGLLDALAAGGAEQVTYLRNLGELRFENATVSAGLAGVSIVIGTALGDIDGDGDPDAILAGYDGLQLYRNDAGVFVDVTDTAFATPTFEAVGVLLVDADNDGAIDVLALSIDPPNRLYRNDGSGTFAEVDVGIGVDVRATSWVAAAVDHDRDGDTDLYVGHDMLSTDNGERPFSPGNGGGGPDHLFENRGYPQYTNVAEQAGVTETRATMGIVFEDMTGDGLRDLFLTDFGRNDLLRAVGDGSFEDATVEMGLEEFRRIDDSCPPDQPLGPESPCWMVSWSALYEDFDLDGVRDLIVFNSDAFGDRHQPVQIWRREDASAPFDRVADPTLGFTGARGAAAADFDGDGDLDLFVPSRESLLLFENTADGPPVLAVSLVGTTSNPEGLGADVTVEYESGRRVTRRMGVGGQPHSWGPTELYFGGASASAVTVRWPSGAESTQTIGEPAGPLVVTEP